MRHVGDCGDLRPDHASASADQPFIGRDQRGVGVDPEPAVAREHLHVEMQMAGGAVRVVEIVRDHADLLAFLDVTAVQHAIGIQRGRIHVHVAEANVLGRGVDLQRRRLLLRRADHDAVADRDYTLFLAIASTVRLAAGGTGAGADTLALVTEAARALPDIEAARLAEIILPGIAGVAAGELVERLVARFTIAEFLRLYEGGRLLQRKADLR